MLKKTEYFGQYGTILKIVVNTANGYKTNEAKEHTYSAYITYSKLIEASIAILAVDGKIINNTNCLRATYGSTKFCVFYLKGKECTNKECLYLHTEANDCDDIIERDDINNKINFKQQQLQAIKIGNIFNFEVRKKIMTSEKILNAILPGVQTIYDNPIVYDSDLNYQEFQRYLIKNRENNINNNKTNEAKSSMNYENTQEYFSKTKYLDYNENDNKEKESSYKTKEKFDENSNNSDSDVEKRKNTLIELNENNLKSSISTTTDSFNNDFFKDTTCKLFKAKTNSRFSFVEDDKNSEIGVEVPKFITHIINNNMVKSNNNFAKMLQHKVIQNILDDEKETEKNSNYNWANFLVSNCTEKEL